MFYEMLYVMDLQAQTIQQPQDVNTLQQEIPNQKQTCKYCKNSIDLNVFFCPLCGKKLKNPPPSTSVLAQIKIYAISVLLPPLGLVPGFQYLLSKDKKAKIIGLIAIILSIISLIISTIYIIDLYKNLTKQFNDLQSLGY